MYVCMNLFAIKIITKVIQKGKKCYNQQKC